jgi:periplasmic protein TonB
MKNNYILIFLILILSKANAQDTTYFNASWSQTSKGNAKYYQVVLLKNQVYSVTNYYMNGQIQMTGQYSSMIPEIKDGKFIHYFESGGISREEQYAQNKKVDVCVIYDQNNNVVSKVRYNEDGTITNLEGLPVNENPDDDAVLTLVEEMPVFPGGEEGLRNYLIQNVVYPFNARKNNVQGRVYIDFVITKDGSVEDVNR